MRLCKITFLSFAVASILHAQNNDLGEITVTTGAYTPQSISEIPSTSYYISNEELKKQINGGKSLGSSLGKLIPGFDLSSEGKTNFGQNLRGRTAVIMIDGVSLNSSRKVNRQLDSIDPNTIDHIEVISGASSLYAGATGGAINIITKKASYDELSGNIYIGAKSGFNKNDDKDKSLGFSLNTNKGNISNRFNASFSKTQAAYDGDGKLIVPDIVQGSNTFNEVIDISNTISYDLSDTQRINFKAQYYTSKQEHEYGFDLGKNYSNIQKAPVLSKEYEADNNPETNRKFFNLDYINEDFYGQSLYSQLSFRTENLEFSPFVTTSSALAGGRLPFFKATTQDTDYLLYKLALNKKLSNKLKITYGFDASKDELTSHQTIFDPTTSLSSNGLKHKTFKKIGRYPKTTVKSYAGFAQLNYKAIKDLNISTGIRQQHINNKIGDFAQTKEQIAVALGAAKSVEEIKGKTSSYDVTLFNLGATYNLNKSSKVWANFSQGFELPDPAKYYGRGEYTLVGDKYVLNKEKNISKLKGIKTNSYEIGYSFSNEKTNLQTSLYYSKSDQNIDLVKSLSEYAIFDQDLRIYGIEGLVNTDLTQNIYLGANFNFLKTEIKKDGTYKKASIFQSSNSKVAYFIGYQNNNMNISLNANSMLSLEDEDNNKINSYTTLDLFGTFKHSKEHTIDFGIENLLDKEYSTIWGEKAKIIYGTSVNNPDLFDYKGRGRTFSLKYTYNF